MNIEKHLTRLNQESQSIFTKSLEYRDELGRSHHYSACIYEFAESIADQSEKDILKTVSSQLESATLIACNGMYRQAFASLRLALEMGLAAAYFSSNKLELQEWLGGKADIKWSSIINENDGVISIRYANAFFDEFKKDTSTYRSKAMEVYRQLSEFVHGNKETWSNSEIELSFNESSLQLYFKKVWIVSDILLFVLSCRYLRSFSNSTLESMEFISEEMNHLDYVRSYFGGPKG